MTPVSITAETLRAVCAANEAQRDTIAKLQAEVGALREALGMKDADHYPRRLSPMQRAMLGMLMRRAAVVRSQFMLAIYAARSGADLPNDRL